jgi:hypothetical protein
MCDYCNSKDENRKVELIYADKVIVKKLCSDCFRKTYGKW